MTSWGPDGRDCWHDGPVGLGQLLLYGTPEDQYERQPFHDSSSGLTMTAEARIDNRDELKYVVLRFLQATPEGPASPGQLEALNTFVAVLGRMRPLPVDLLNQCIGDEFNELRDATASYADGFHQLIGDRPIQVVG